MSYLHNTDEEYEEHLFEDEDDDFEEDTDGAVVVEEKRESVQTVPTQTEPPQVATPQAVPTQMEETTHLTLEEYIDLHKEGVSEKVRKIGEKERLQDITLNDITDSFVYLTQAPTADLKSIRWNAFELVMNYIKKVTPPEQYESKLAEIIKGRPDDTKYQSFMRTMLDKQVATLRQTDNILSDKDYITMVTLFIMGFSVAVWEYLEDRVEIEKLTGVAYFSETVLKYSDAIQYGIATTLEDTLTLYKNNILAIQNGISLQDYKVKEEVEQPQEEEVESLVTVDNQLKATETLTIEQQQREFIKDQSESVADDILAILEILYKPAFVSKPYGVLSRNNHVIRWDKVNNKWQEDMFSKRVATKVLESIDTVYFGSEQYLREGQLTSKISAEFFVPKEQGGRGEMSINSLPLVHLYHVNGITTTGTGDNLQVKVVKNWAKMKSIITANINKYVHGLMLYGFSQGFDIDVMALSIKELFVNVCIVKEYNSKMVMNLQYYYNVMGQQKTERGTSRYFTGLELANHLETHARSVFEKSAGALVSKGADKWGVVSFVYAFNKAKYDGELMFTYKLFKEMIESGVSPSLSSTVLGRKTSGDPFAVNLEAQTMMALAVIAGSRSGKGVMTMGLVASIIGSGNALMYIDNKPDMAAAFWHLERQYGIKTFAVDGIRDFTEKGGVQNRKREAQFKQSIPSYLFNENVPVPLDNVRVLVYIKAIQVFLLSVEYRISAPQDETMAHTGVPWKEHYKSQFYSEASKVVAVLDELQAANASFGSIAQGIGEMKVDSDKSAGVYGEEVVQYYRKIDALINDLRLQVNSYFQKDAGIGRGLTISLGQRVNPGKWDWAGTNWKYSPIAGFVMGASARLIGADNKEGGTPTYSIDSIKDKIEGGSTLGQTGFFGFHMGAITQDPNDVTMLKSYFVLNENDLERNMTGGSVNYDSLDAKGTFTGGLLKNVGGLDKQQEIVKTELLNEDGSVNKHVGFDGVMEMVIQSTLENKSEQAVTDALRKHLSMGYDLAMDALRWSGIFVNELEDFLYDASYENLWTTSQLKKRKPLEGRSSGTGEEEVGEHAGELESEALEHLEGTGSTDFDLYDQSEEPPTPIQTAETQELEWGNNPHELPHIPVLENEHQEEDTKPTWENTAELPTQEGVQSLTKVPNLEKVVDQEPLLNQPNTIQKQPEYQQPLEERQPQKQGQLTSTSPLQNIGEEDKYTEPLDLPINLFKGKKESGVAMVAETSVLLLKSIAQMVGGLDRVFKITFGGQYMSINGIPFSPQIDAETVEAMPFDIKRRIKRGDVSELFDFRDLKKFNRLNTVVFESVEQAENRVRPELLLHPSKSWSELFKKFPTWMYIHVGGMMYSREEWESGNVQESKAEQGYKIQQDFLGGLRSSLGTLPSLVRPVSEFVERKTPLRLFKNATVATAATWATLTIATAFGGWGLLWGGIVGFGAYKHVKGKK